MEFKNFFSYTELFATFMVLSPWPIFFSYIFYYALGGNINYKAYIGSKRALFKHLFLLLMVLMLVVGIFILRLEKRGKKVDLYNYWNTLLGQLKFGDPEESYIILLGIIILGIFWMLALKLMYMYLKRSLVILYTYGYSIKWFRNQIVFRLTDMGVAYNFFLTRRVKLFTENDFIIYNVATFIWPKLINMLEERIFRFLIPYLYIMDIIANDGVISKVFDVLPGMFIYSGLRGLYNYVCKLHDVSIMNMSHTLYDLLKLLKQIEKEKVSKKNQPKQKNKKNIKIRPRL